MVRSTLAGAGLVGMLLAGGAYLWSRQSGSVDSQSHRDVIVVQGSGTSQAKAAQRPAQRSGQVLISRGVLRVETEGGKGIADDAELHDSLPGPSLEPAALYRRVRAEKRDIEWAPRSERDIRAALSAVPYTNPDDLRVSCASTLCEVRGAMADGLSNENANVAMEAMQGQRFQLALGYAGLQSAATTFGSNKRDARTFTMYTKRR